MHPIEIIAVMRNKGWLRTEPSNSKEKVTSSVRYLMIKHRMRASDLAEAMGGVSEVYLRRKIIEYRWQLNDLDTLADAFDLNQSDIVAGYRWLEDLDLIHYEQEKHEDE